MEPSKDEGTPKNVPVYLSFATFQTAIETLRTHGLPRRLDRSAWDSRSGADQTQILSAFKFLGFIDENFNTQPSLERLKEATAGSAEEKQVLAEILRERYLKVFEYDLKTATPKNLSDAIGSYGATGTTKDRALRFFIKAARYSGIPMSPRFVRVAAAASVNTTGNVAPKGSSPTRNTKPKKKAQNGSDSQIEDQKLNHDHGTAMRTIKLPIAGGTLTVSGTFNAFALSGAERELVYLIIDKMSEYEKSQSKEDRK